MGFFRISSGTTKWLDSLVTSNSSEGFNPIHLNFIQKDGCFLWCNKCQKWPRIHLGASGPVELPGAAAAP